MSAWQDALDAELRCPHCGATNRPGVTYIVREPDGQAVCTVCGKAFPLEPKP